MNVIAVTALAVGLMTTQSVSGATYAFVPLPGDVKSASSVELSWLRNKLGDDGYIRVFASLDLEAPCLPVGRGGWASLIFKEKVQLAVTVKITGLSSPLADKEIPVAAVDGRDSPGGCIEVNNATITLVPTTRLRGLKLDEPLAVQVKARTTSDKNLNLVSTARAGLTVASLVASPAAAATISTVSKVVADPALANVEKYMEARMAGRVPAQATRKLTVKEFRDGISEVTFPVYLGEYGFNTDMPYDEAKAIPLIAAAKLNSKEPPIFRVRLTFVQTRTIFPLTYKADGTPARESILDGDILSHPGDEDVPTVYQWLSGSTPNDPKLLQLFASATTASEFRDLCKKALEILSNRGLNLLDRSLALRSFINTARGSESWYGTTLANGCTQDNRIGQTWLAVFGPAPPPTPPLNAEIMSRPPAGQDELYESWLRRSIPTLTNLRTALKASENQEAYLLKATKGADLTILASKAEAGWPEVQSGVGEKPWVARITAKRAKAVGCFNYPYGSNEFDLETTAGSFLILDEKGIVWVARASFSTANSSGLGELEIFQLNSGWKTWYQGLVERGLLSSQGDCGAIIKTLPTAPLGEDG